MGESEVLWQMGETTKSGISGNLCLRAQTWEMKKVVGVIFFSLVFFMCYHPNPEMANYRDTRRTNKQINTWENKHLHTQDSCIFSLFSYTVSSTYMENIYLPESEHG